MSYNENKADEEQANSSIGDVIVDESVAFSEDSLLLSQCINHMTQSVFEFSDAIQFRGYSRAQCRKLFLVKTGSQALPFFLVMALHGGYNLDRNNSRNPKIKSIKIPVRPRVEISAENQGVSYPDGESDGQPVLKTVSTYLSQSAYYGFHGSLSTVGNVSSALTVGRIVTSFASECLLMCILGGLYVNNSSFESGLHPGVLSNITSLNCGQWLLGSLILHSHYLSEAIAENNNVSPQPNWKAFIAGVKSSKKVYVAKEDQKDYQAVMKMLDEWSENFFSSNDYSLQTLRNVINQVPSLSKLKANGRKMNDLGTPEERNPYSDGFKNLLRERSNQWKYCTSDARTWLSSLSIEVKCTVVGGGSGDSEGSNLETIKAHFDDSGSNMNSA